MLLTGPLLSVFLLVPSMALNLGPSHLTASQKAALEQTATLIATPGKGITACDEGPATIGARFEKVGISNSEEQRRLYRQMLFTAPGCENYLSAAILDPETLYQVGFFLQPRTICFYNYLSPFFLHIIPCFY